MDKYVKYEKPVYGQKTRFSRLPDFELMTVDGLLNSSVVLSSGSQSFVSISSSIYLNFLSTLTFASSTFAFGLDDFVVEFEAKIGAHQTAGTQPYLLATSRSTAGTGFYCLVKGETTVFASEAVIFFSTSSAVPLAQRMSLSSISILRFSGWNHIAFVREGLVHYLYVNGVLEAISTQTAKTNYGVETARLNSDSQNIGNGNNINIRNFRIYRGFEKPTDYRKWIKNEKIIFGDTPVLQNKRLYGSSSDANQQRKNFFCLKPSPVFHVDVSLLKLQTAINVGQKIQTIKELISGNDIFQNDTNKAPKLAENFYAEFENSSGNLILPIPLNDSQFPINKNRIGFFIVRTKKRDKLGASLFGSLLSQNVYCCGSEADYIFSAGVGSKVYGIRDDIPIIVPNTFLLVEIIRDGYYEIRLNGIEIGNSTVPIRSQTVTPQYSLEKIGGNLSFGEIILYSLPDSIETKQFTLKKEKQLLKKWRIKNVQF